MFQERECIWNLSRRPKSNMPVQRAWGGFPLNFPTRGQQKHPQNRNAFVWAMATHFGQRPMAIGKSRNIPPPPLAPRGLVFWGSRQIKNNTTNWTNLGGYPKNNTPFEVVDERLLNGPGKKLVYPISQEHLMLNQPQCKSVPSMAVFMNLCSAPNTH